MKNLSVFIKDEFVKQNIDKLFENCICIDTIDKAIDFAVKVGYGNYANIVFTSSLIKDRFIDKISTIHPDLNVINCNCTIDSFFENSFNGYLIFNNLKRCQHMEIIEEIKKYNAVLLC